MIRSVSVLGESILDRLLTKQAAVVVCYVTCLQPNNYKITRLDL